MINEKFEKELSDYLYNIIKDICNNYPELNNSKFNLDKAVLFIFTFEILKDEQLHNKSEIDEYVKNIIEAYVDRFEEKLQYILQSIDSDTKLRNYIKGLKTSYSKQKKQLPYDLDIEQCMDSMKKALSQRSNIPFNNKDLYFDTYSIYDIKEDLEATQKYFDLAVQRQISDDKYSKNPLVQEHCLKNEVEKIFETSIDEIDVQRKISFTQFEDLDKLYNTEEYQQFFINIKSKPTSDLTPLDNVLSIYNSIVDIDSKIVVEDTYKGDFIANNCLVKNQKYSLLYLHLVYLGLTVYRFVGSYIVDYSNPLIDAIICSSSEKAKKVICKHNNFSETHAEDIILNEDNTISCTKKVFNPNVPAKFYQDIKTMDIIANTAEEFPYPHIKYTENSDTSVIGKFNMFIFKGNEEAIKIWENILARFIQTRKAPDADQLFVTKDANGEAIESVLFYPILQSIFLIEQCLGIDSFDLSYKFPQNWKDNLILFVNNIPITLTDTEKRATLKNLNTIKSNTSKHILKILKTCDVSLLGLHKEPDAYCAYEINDHLCDCNYLGFGTLVELQKAIYNQVGAYYNKLSKMEISKDTTFTQPYDGKFMKYLQGTGNRLQSHIDAYLKFDIEFFEYILTRTDNMKDMELLLEVKKCLESKKPYVSQLLINKVLIATEKIKLTRQDINNSCKALYPEFFSSDGSNNTRATTFMGKTSSDQKYWLNTKFNPFYKG